VKIVQLAVDWKEDYDLRAINRAAKAVGGKKLLYECHQGDAACKVMFVSSHYLDPDQVDKLWKVGDLWLDNTVKGKSFDDLLKNLKAKRQEWNKET